jgi:hypothetical protein
MAERRRDSANKLLIVHNSIKNAGDKVALSLLAKRQLEKQKSRDEDAKALTSGEKTREQLKKENGHFVFEKVKVSLKEAKPLK